MYEVIFLDWVVELHQEGSAIKGYNPYSFNGQPFRGQKLLHKGTNTFKKFENCPKCGGGAKLKVIYVNFF